MQLHQLHHHRLQTLLTHASFNVLRVWLENACSQFHTLLVSKFYRRLTLKWGGMSMKPPKGCKTSYDVYIAKIGSHTPA